MIVFLSMNAAAEGLCVLCVMVLFVFSVIVLFVFAMDRSVLPIVVMVAIVRGSSAAVAMCAIMMMIAAPLCLFLRRAVSRSVNAGICRMAEMIGYAYDAVVVLGRDAFVSASVAHRSMMMGARLMHMFCFDLCFGCCCCGVLVFASVSSSSRW